MNTDTFILLVIEMRKQQQEYLISKSIKAAKNARRLEQQIDEMINTYRITEFEKRQLKIF